MLRTIAAALTLLVTLCWGAFAQTPAPNNACRGDATKLCANVKPGEGRVIACLVEQKEKLSADCVRLLTSMKALK
jgi:hypothetical protein